MNKTYGVEGRIVDFIGLIGFKDSNEVKIFAIKETLWAI